MTVALWWKSRLEAGDPIRSPRFRLAGYDVKERAVIHPTAHKWPKAVARQALYADYLCWHDEVYLLPLRDVPFFQDFPERLPEPANELRFFTTLLPFMYVFDRSYHNRNYMVQTSRQFEGRWITVKANRYFYRLVEWEAHVAAYKLETGTEISAIPSTLNEREQADLRVSYDAAKSSTAVNKLKVSVSTGKAKGT